MIVGRVIILCALNQTSTYAAQARQLLHSSGLKLVVLQSRQTTSNRSVNPRDIVSSPKHVNGVVAVPQKHTMARQSMPPAAPPQRKRKEGGTITKPLSKPSSKQFTKKSDGIAIYMPSCVWRVTTRSRWISTT